MGRQPYIPFYIGDYLKDTRVLPLSVRGLWVDLICFMWDAPHRGELVGTLDEVARMVGCDAKEAEFALNLLKQKKTADIDLLPSGEFRIVSRKMKRDHEISKERSKAGKKGIQQKFANTFAKAKRKAKAKQNTDIDIDIDIDNEIKIDKESKINFPFPTEKFKASWAAWKDYRKEIKKPYRSEMSENVALKNLGKYSEETAIAMIENSIANGWQGIFELKNKNDEFGRSGKKAANGVKSFSGTVYTKTI